MYDNPEPGFEEPMSSRSLEQVMQEGYTVNMTQYIKDGWEIFKTNPGLFLGFWAIIFVINLGLGFIPILGSIVAMAISVPLGMGIFIVSAKIIKQQPVEFGDFF